MQNQNNEVENNDQVCPVCHQDVLPNYYFCPNCGTNLKGITAPVSAIVQIGLYALALFLPPLGLWPGVKYLMKKNKQAKIVGGVTIALTLISSIVTIWWIFSIFNGYMAEVNELMTGF